MSVPRPQFQSVNGGKRVTTNRMAPQMMPSLPPPSSQHDDIIKFIFDSWTKVNREFSEQNFAETGRSPTVTYYQEREPNPLLKDFEPFDLEAYWGRRFYETRTPSTS